MLDVTHDPCAVRIVADEASDGELESLHAALDLWNERGDFRLSLAVTGENSTALPLVVRFERQFGAFRGFYDDEAGEITINRALRGEARTIAIAHELGHAFGLFHVERSARRSVMNPGNTTVGPLPGDIAEVRALWGACP